MGRGEKIKDVLGGMNAVAEGVVTARAVYHLAQKKKMDMPIVTEVYKIIFENKSASECHERFDGPFFKIRIEILHLTKKKLSIRLSLNQRFLRIKQQ